jgi:hypothetical protein
MLGYKGELTDGHLRATIRTALVARGFVMGELEFAASAAQQQSAGLWLRDQVFPARLQVGALGRSPSFADADPDLWNRLPLMAGLGFRQTELFGSLLQITPDAGAESAILGGAFNAAIALFDYLIDETGAGERLFSLLTERVVRAIFAEPDQARQVLAETAARTKDARECYLFALIAFCAETGQRMLMASGNGPAWMALGETIGRLFESQRRIAGLSWPLRDEARRLLPILEAKSCLPSHAALQIAQLAEECPGHSADLKPAALRLGRIFWLIDDLVDVLKDLRTGTPNAVVIHLADRLAEEDRWSTSDTDLYDEIDGAVNELVPLLEFSGPDDGVNAIVTQFGRFAVAGWTAWYEQTPPGPRIGRSGPVESSALAFLLAQQKSTYSEAIHHLSFPRLVDGEVRYETRPALLSHRAVVLDALLDATMAGLDCPRAVLAAECMAILRSKHRDVRGGWSYIQEAPELPPDADDLGQVLQALMRFGGPALASICDEAIRLALDGADADGGFNTWLLDPSRGSPADETIRQYLGIMGGWGVHSEVVANLLYGLLLYDPERFDGALHRAITYLEKVQAPDGTWPSKWYAGPFYGTWRVVSVLGLLNPAHSALAHARRSLMGSIHSDGSWGRPSPEPLSTAFAVLALCANGMKPDASAVGGGVAYLARTQEADGSWPSCPWISFPTIDGEVVHGSRTITTAFCLKALLASHQAGESRPPTFVGSARRVS